MEMVQKILSASDNKLKKELMTLALSKVIIISFLKGE